MPSPAITVSSSDPFLSMLSLSTNSMRHPTKLGKWGIETGCKMGTDHNGSFEWFSCILPCFWNSSIATTVSTGIWWKILASHKVETSEGLENPSGAYYHWSIRASFVHIAKRPNLGPTIATATAATTIAAKGTRCSLGLVAIQLATGGVHLGQSGFALASGKRWKRPKALKGYGKSSENQKKVASREKQSCVGSATKSSRRMKANILIPPFNKQKKWALFFWSQAVPTFN